MNETSYLEHSEECKAAKEANNITRTQNTSKLLTSSRISSDEEFETLRENEMELEETASPFRSDNTLSLDSLPSISGMSFNKPFWSKFEKEGICNSFAPLTVPSGSSLINDQSDFKMKCVSEAESSRNQCHVKGKQTNTKKETSKPNKSSSPALLLSNETETESMDVTRIFDQQLIDLCPEGTSFEPYSNDQILPEFATQLFTKCVTVEEFAETNSKVNELQVTASNLQENLQTLVTNMDFQFPSWFKTLKTVVQQKTASHYVGGGLINYFGLFQDYSTVIPEHAIWECSEQAKTLAQSSNRVHNWSELLQRSQENFQFGGYGVLPIIKTSEGQTLIVSKNKRPIDMASLLEIEILTKHWHPNLLHAKFFFQVNTKFYLAFDMSEPKISLADYLECQKSILKDEKVAFVGREILQGLQFLQDHKVVHCQLQSQNLFLFQNRVQIGNFSFACTEEYPHTGKFFSTYRATTMYSAPEQFCENSKVSHLTDVWSFGVIFAETLSNIPGGPFHAAYQQSTSIQKTVIESFQRRKSIQCIANSAGNSKFIFSQPHQQILMKCLSYDIENRLSARELLKDSFFHVTQVLFI